MLEVKIENGTMMVKSEYNAKFVKKAQNLQGKWEKPYWIFPKENEEPVRNALLEIYGEDGNPCETVSVDIHLDKYRYGNELKLDSLLIASRIYRDYSVKLANNAIVIAGEFCPSGGSRNNPAVTHESGTIVRVKDLPISIYSRVSTIPGVYLADENPDDAYSHLESEKAALLQRIAEIDKLLLKGRGNQ